MALEDILANIRNQSLAQTADDRTVNRIGPVQLNRPKNLTALDRKYADPGYQQAISQLPEPVRQAIQQTDLRRIDRGQSPVNAENSIKAGVAAMTGQQVTPVQDRRDSWTSIPANAVGDLAQIVKSLPQLPGALVGEVKDVADGFADDKAEMAAQGKTGLAATLSLPGIRMIPGTFAASNALSDRQSFIEDPLLNVLDVLPIAGKIAKGTKVVKAETLARAGSTKITGEAVKPVRPLKVLATRTLDEAGDVVPNRLGQVIERGMDTKPMQAISDTFGQQARQTSRIGVMAEQGAERRAVMPKDTDIVGTTFREFQSLRDPEKIQAKYGITPERADEIGLVGRVDRNQLGPLPENESRFVADWDRANETLAQYIADTHGELVKVGDEWFDKRDGNRLTRSQDLVAKKITAVVGDTGYGGKQRGIMDDLDALADVDPRWTAIRDLVDQRDFSGASRSMEDLIAGTKKVNQLKWYNNAAVPINDQRMFTIRRTLNEAKGAATAYQRLRKTINPARFDELINERAGKTWLDSLEEKGVLTDRGRAEEFLQGGAIDQIRNLVREGDEVTPEKWAREWAKHRAGVRNTWEKLKEAGEDPIYMSRVTERRANRIGVARFDGTARGLSTARARVSDVSPSLNSPAISVTNQAWDIIQREGAAEMTRQIQSDFGRSQQALLDEFTPLAMAELDRRGLGIESLSVVRDDLIKTRWTPFDPGSMMPFQGSAGPLGEQKWIPRQVGETLKKANSEGLSKLRALNDPVTRLWRISLLPLSPRWHLYNIVGGSVMMSAEVGPQAFRHIGQAREILKAVKEGGELPRWVPRELERNIGLIGKEEAALALKRGASASRWWQESTIGKAGRGFVQKSFDLNSYFDDLYKTMSYLEGESQALSRFKKAGMEDDVARGLAAEEGINAARKVLQDTAAMTPFERSVLRQIFPFYSWLSHLMRFVFNYPADHPWRTAIVASGSRIVMEDMGDGASTDMLDILSWGERDEQGRQKSVNVRGLNPFSDAANLFTLAGWLGSTNPLFQTATQALGFDAMQGGIDLYPQMSYSPETGKMVVDTGNPIKNFAVNSLPQLGALVRYAGQDPEFNKLMREDPETAQRILFSGVGIPGSYKRYSREQDLVGNELKRQEAASDSTSTAYKTGNLDALEPFLGKEAVEALKKARESGAIDDYLPSNSPTTQLPGAA